MCLNYKFLWQLACCEGPSAAGQRGPEMVLDMPRFRLTEKAQLPGHLAVVC